ncbi:MAG: mannosyltransferase [Solirubrobacteraceae bacterium]|nr:mannosyltransferase [Solirubrobacteraceae bacterium]
MRAPLGWPGMAVTAAPIHWPRAGALVRTPVVTPLGLGLLAAGSVLVRTVHFGTGFWVDEGLSVGIADRPITDIPGVMRLDGSPPAYYLLLHLWIRLVGQTSEVATHALSLLLATLTIPVAWALVRALFGERAGWIAAVLFAFNPFLNAYAQETRMYTLVVLLGLVSVACFVGAFALGRSRRWTIGFAVAHAALLWTHNWGIFLGFSLAVCWAVLALRATGDERRRIVREGLVAAGVIVILYAAWIPTVLFQVAHTGAPWANAPKLAQLGLAPSRLLGGSGQWLLLIGAGAGLVPLLRERSRSWPPESRAAFATVLVALLTILVPWVVSQVSPAWATRYLAVAVPPLLLGVTIGLSRAGRLGLAVLALTALIWLGYNGNDEKSNVSDVAASVAPSLARGDLVISTQPEQVPVFNHYLTEQGVTGLRWATLWGPLKDVGVTDWRDGVKHLEATSPSRDLVPLLDATRPGQRVVLLQPDFSNLPNWRAPWLALVRERSATWEERMRNDRRFRVLSIAPTSSFPSHPNPVRTLVLVREPVG